LASIRLRGLAAVAAAVGTIMGSIQRYVTNRLGSTKVLEIPSFWLSYAVSTVEFIRIVAPKVAGSSPVGHPPHKYAVCRMPLRSSNAMPWGCSSSTLSSFARVSVSRPAYRRPPSLRTLVNIRSTALSWKESARRTVTYWPRL
jgi:hypothetical protein